MNDPFHITVSYKGEEFTFPARFMRYGYTHRIIVSVNEQDIVFEPDEEGNYRALVDAIELSKNQIDAGLLQALAQIIENSVR